MKWVLLLAVLMGCATTPGETPVGRMAREMEKCLQAGPCFLIHVENDGDHTVVVRLNSVKVGEVSAWSKGTFAVRESVLRDGRCAQAQLALRLHGGKGQSDRQCLRPGGYFTLLLDSQYKIVLTPWGGR